MKYKLLISAVYTPEPVVSARLTEDIYCYLLKKGYKVKVLHPFPTRPAGFQFDETIRFGEDEILTDSFTCPKNSLVGRIWESISFGKSCRKFIRIHHDEIECIYANAWPIYSQFAIVKAAKKYQIPSIIHVQDIYPESLTNKLPLIIREVVRSLIMPIDKYILRKSHKVVAISEKMKGYLVDTRGIEDSKVDVVINWQDEKDFLDNKQEIHGEDGKHPFTFMYMGNIGPVAGVDLLIEAFKVAKIDNSCLVIAGSGSMKESMKKLAHGYSNIDFWDVPNGKVPEVQSMADCMLLPIKKGAAGSSIPSKLSAYMFSAKPIIGCVDEGSDTANAILDAKCGWVIEPENVGVLARKMEAISQMPSGQLKVLGANAKEYGMMKLSKDVNLGKLVNIIVDCQ